MASHGIPRVASGKTRSAEEYQKEQQRIKDYLDLKDLVHSKLTEQEYTPEVLQKTSELLSQNPEYYTIWNGRRLILRQQFQNAIPASNEPTSGALDARQTHISHLIKTDLQFLVPLLRQYPKCYWIWNYRLWLLEEATSLLPPYIARQFWEGELVLVGKMLTFDGRNFHGWGYRRAIIAALADITATIDGEAGEPTEASKSAQELTNKELEYTTKMIKGNLSNFSAWHNRTKLALKILNDASANDEKRKKMLDDELKLIHRALFDPYDQSLWFYHQDLMCTFDPDMASQTMAPNLDNPQRLDYVNQEIEMIEELLDGADDCKWVYQALVNCTLLAAKLEGTISAEAKENISKWVKELHKLDPLRRGRWEDLERSLGI
ncbi:Rab geranylgeranyltransferase [Arachnomyces sp. PD_36]|nr:Rab geranylgeranyltransferase [Arachnomyces sp. PD_36]